MHPKLKTILLYLYNKKYIGGSHKPENKLLKTRTKWLNKKEQKQFWKEYKKLVNEGIILRSNIGIPPLFEWCFTT